MSVLGERVSGRIDVPITGAVLRWAIDESGYTTDEFAEGIGRDVETVHAWIDESERPSKTEFGTLVDRLKRPSAVFFLPAAPDTTPIQTELRSLPGVSRSQMHPGEARWLRRAHSIQELAAWVAREVGDSAPMLPVVRRDQTPDSAAIDVREALGVTVPEQISWGAPTHALAEWRWAVERLGVATFELPLGAAASRGMSLWHDQLPVVVVNKRGNNPQSRAFTLFHELGHLLLGTTSMCVGYVAVRGSSAGHPGAERWCDRFAAALLMPRHEFSQQARKTLGHLGKTAFTELDEVRTLTTAFNASMRATSLRLIDVGFATEDLYGQVNALRRRQKVTGGRSQPRPQLRVQQYGERLISTLLDASDRDLLGRHELMRTLKVSSDELASISRALPTTR